MGFKLAKPAIASNPQAEPDVTAALAKKNTSVAKKSFPQTSLGLSFKSIMTRPNDIAVIIGNADYKKSGRDIPDVVPAYADADDFKRYAMTALGILEGNIIDLRDASQAELITVFGSDNNHEGKLFNWTLPGLSNVVIYYAGHGAPGEESSAYLVPVDADPSTLHLNGFRLDLLYANLSKIPAKSMTVVLEACFSGASSGGFVISNASPVFLKVKDPVIPKGITVIAAGGADQMASWEQDKSHGLFTKYYLTGMSGEADKLPYGDQNGIVSISELKSYLAQTMTYLARRYYGRDQNVQIVTGAIK